MTLSISVGNAVRWIVIALCLRWRHQLGYSQIRTFCSPQSVGIECMNYFYTFDLEGSSVLEQFWEWVPVPYLYLIVPNYVFFLGAEWC